MEITYFPYLNMGDIEEFAFGNVKVWNFKKKARDYIPDEMLRNKIQVLLHSNVRHNNPIEDIGVVSIGKNDFRHFNEQELGEIDALRLILFLCTVSKNTSIKRGTNSGIFMSTSENFISVRQTFDLKSNSISEQDGFIVHVRIGGYEIGEIEFKAPSYILTTPKFRMDDLLLKQLLILRTNNKRFFDRVMRAADLLFQSYFNDPNVSHNARILLQSGAFETLLALPEEQQRKNFKDRIEEYTVTSSDKPKIYWFEYWDKRAKGWVKKKDKRAIQVIWSDHFYTLRNHIIHGNKIHPSEYDFQKCQRHLDISLLFFILCLKKLINKKLRRKIFFDRIKWETYKEDYGNQEFDGFIYEDNQLLACLYRSQGGRNFKALF